MNSQNRKNKKPEQPHHRLYEEREPDKLSVAFIGQYSKCIWVEKSFPLSIRFFFIN